MRNMPNKSALALALAAIFGSAPAHATLAVTGSAPGVRIATTAAPTPSPIAAPTSFDAAQRSAMRDESSARIYGVIDTVDPAQGRVVIFGKPLHFDAARVLVVSRVSGKLSAYALKPHQKVHFQLDPKDASQRTVRTFFLP